jgi:hypothetical protein
LAWKLHLRQEAAIPEPCGRGNRDDRGIAFRLFRLLDVADLHPGNPGGLWALEAGILTKRLALLNWQTSRVGYCFATFTKTSKTGFRRPFVETSPIEALGYATPGELYHSPESYGAKPAAWRWK